MEAELIEELKLENQELKDDAELFKAQKRMGLQIASVGIGVGFLFGGGQLGWAPCDQDSGRYTVVWTGLIAATCSHILQIGVFTGLFHEMFGLMFGRPAAPPPAAPPPPPPPPPPAAPTGPPVSAQGPPAYPEAEQLRRQRGLVPH